MAGWQQPTSVGQLTSQAHNRVGKNQQHLCMAREWAGGGFQLGPSRCPWLTEGLASQKGGSEVPKESEGQVEAQSSTGRPGKAPREPRAVPSRCYNVQKGPVSWRLDLRTPWITTPGAEGKRES